MTTRVRLIRRLPREERKKPIGERKRWVWLLRWHEGYASLPAETVGYYAESRDDWRPTRGSQVRLTLEEAGRARERKQGELNTGTAKPRPSPSAGMPWTEFCETYVAETKGTVQDSTLQSYGESLQIFAAAAGPRTPDDVTPAMVKRFIQAMRDKGRSDATTKKHIASLKRIWNDPATGFSKRGNPFVLGRSIRLVCQAKEWHRHTSDEIQAVMSTCPDL